MGSKKASVVGSAPILTPEQRGLQNQEIGQARSALGNINLDLSQNPYYQSALSESDSFKGDFPIDEYQNRFQQGVYDPAIRNFQQRTRPDLVSMGQFGSGARNSSTLDQALAAAQKDLSLDLASLSQQNQAQGYENYANRRFQNAGLQADLAKLPLASLLPFIQQSYTQAQSPIVEPGREGMGSSLIKTGLTAGLGALLGPAAGLTAGAGAGSALFGSGFGASR